jgi:protein-S-isoprenylcysteine O-methyltransferase Ste14
MTAVADIQERRTKRHVHAYAGHPLSRFLVRRRTVFAAVVPWLVFAFAEPEVLLYGLGLGVLALGSGLRVWAAGHLRKDEELTTSGPYAHCQHPLYCASLVQVAGVGLMSGRLEALLGLLAAFALIYWPTIAAERRMLADVFGGVYEAYCRRVPQFWPRL